MSDRHTMEELKIRQGLPLEVKVRMTKQRIREWVDEFGVDGVYVAFSGGKDSSVLLHMVRSMFPDVPAVFCDTGLEYPDIRDFVKTFENVVWLKPQKNFKSVVLDVGYPVVSKEVSQGVWDIRVCSAKHNIKPSETKLYKLHFDRTSKVFKPNFSWAKYIPLLYAPFKISHKWCDIMKKRPSKKYEKETGRKPILATMASESRLRTTRWLKDGCNAFESARPTSKPMSFWTEQDVLKYIQTNHLPIASVYGDIVPDYEVLGVSDGQISINDILGEPNDYPLKTTGCSRTGCMFCLFGCSRENYDNLTEMKRTHPKQYDFIMKPIEKGGLGYKEVIDWMNENLNLNIKY